MGQQVKFLGKRGLGEGAPRGGIARRPVHGEAPPCELAFPFGAAQVEFVRLQPAHHAVQSDKGFFGEAVDSVELLEGYLGAFHPQQRLGSCVGAERLAAFGAGLVFDVGNQRHAFHPLQRELVDDVKRANALYFRTKKF